MSGILWTVRSSWFCLTAPCSQRDLLSCWHSRMCLCPTGINVAQLSAPDQMSGAAFLIFLHGQDTHLFLCPAISASPWLQKVDVSVASVLGKGFWSIFKVVIWLWKVHEGKMRPHRLLYFTKTIPKEHVFL